MGFLETMQLEMELLERDLKIINEKIKNDIKVERR